MLTDLSTNRFERQRNAAFDNQIRARGADTSLVLQYRDDFIGGECLSLCRDPSLRTSRDGTIGGEDGATA
jgi:hypothetical protein